MSPTAEAASCSKPPDAALRRDGRAASPPRGSKPQKADFVYHPSFALPGAEQKYWGSGREPIAVWRYRLLPELTGSDAPDAPPGRTSLTAHQESVLFLRYNYAKYRLSKLCGVGSSCRSGGGAAQVALWRRRAQDVREKIIHANLPLVPSMAGRMRPSAAEYSELISEGYMAVLRSVEKFDVSRGYKFSTYACRSILKCFSRLAVKQQRFRRRFPVGFDPDLERSDYGDRRHEMQRADSIEALRDVLSRNRAGLSGVERTVILERFSILSRDKPRTLTEVGKIVGLTNERVRQIEKKSLRKIRGAYERHLTGAP